MTRLNVNDARCVALFASGLQRADAPDVHAVPQAVSRTVRRFGIGGCAGLMAQEFGDHPEAAAARMRWVRQVIGESPGRMLACLLLAGGAPPEGASSQRVRALSAACA
jgi:hypothetical protein